MHDSHCGTHDHFHCWMLGYKFIKWGLGFFIFGLLVGFGVLIHYLMGSDYNNTGDFLSNITLWFGSPLSLSAGYLQLCGLGMAAVGGACLCMKKCDPNAPMPSPSECGPMDKHLSLTLANLGLILLFLTGYIGYFVIDAIWPSFYYSPIMAAKNLWLILQGASILIYLIGLIMAYSYICCCKKSCRI